MGNMMVVCTYHITRSSIWVSFATNFGGNLKCTILNKLKIKIAKIYNLELRYPRCVYNKMSRVRSVKHNYLIVVFDRPYP